MSKTKKLFLSVLTLALACCFTIGLSSVKTFAATTLDGFDVTGASIRVVEPYGLRFHTQVPEGEKANYTYGTLIIPKADLGDNELTYDTAKALKVTATQWQSDTEYTVVLGGKADGEGNVTNFPATQYNSPILARSYVLDGEGTVVYYTNTVERTYAGIAATGLAVTEGENVITNTDTIAFLNGIVDGVIGQDGFSLTQSELTLEVGSPAVTLTDLVSTENSNEGLTIKWSVDGADCLNVTADEKGIITAISAKTAGVATLTATLGSSVQTLTVNVVGRIVEENEVLDIRRESDIADYTATKNSTITWQATGPDGVTGVAKFEAHGNWSYFGFKPVQDMSNFVGAKYLVVRMYVESCGDNVLWFSGLSDKCYTAVETGKWVDYYFDGAYFLERWANFSYNYGIDVHGMSVKYAGVYYIDKVFVAYDCASLGLSATVPTNAKAGDTLSVTLNNPNEVAGVTMTVTDPLGNNVEQISSFIAEAGTYTITISKDGYLDITETFVVTRPVGENEVLDILTASDITTYSATKNSTITYLPSYEGAKGVAKLQANANWAYFGIKPIQDMSKYENASYLVIRMWVETCQEGKLWLSGYSDKCYTPVQTGKWVDYYFDGAWFLERWANCVNNFGIDVHGMSVKYSGDVCYIDKVFVAYDCSTLGLESVVNGNLVEGETLSVTLSNPNNATGVTMTVTDPNGKNIEDISSFVAEPGTYTITISKDGYEDYVDTFTVARIIAENEVVDFRYASDVQLAHIVYDTNVNSIEYLDSYNGANGVLKVDSKGWGRLGFRGLHGQGAEVYTSAKYLVVRMWIETANSSTFTYIGTSFSEAENQTYTKLQTGRWVNYYFNASSYLWNDFPNYYASMGIRYDSVYYIDKIYVTNEQEVVEVLHANDVSSFVNQNNAPITYVEEYAGVKNVARIDAGSWSELKWNSNMSLEKYSGKYLVIRMNASVASNFQIAASNGTQLTDVVPGEWTDVYFDANAYLTQWTDTGNYYSALIFKSAGTFYIDSIYIVDKAPETLTVIDFANETVVSSCVKNQWDTTPTYVAEHQGAKGVLKVDATKDYGTLSFKPLLNLNMAENYTHVVIRVWVDTAYAGSGGNGIKLPYNASSYNPITTGCWYECAFNANDFVSAWNQYGWTDYRASMVFGYAGVFYIDSIYFTNIAE